MVKHGYLPRHDRAGRGSGLHEHTCSAHENIPDDTGEHTPRVEPGQSGREGQGHPGCARPGKGGLPAAGPLHEQSQVEPFREEVQALRWRRVEGPAICQSWSSSTASPAATPRSRWLWSPRMSDRRRASPAFARSLGAAISPMLASMLVESPALMSVPFFPERGHQDRVRPAAVLELCQRGGATRGRRLNVAARESGAVPRR